VAFLYSHLEYFVSLGIARAITLRRPLRPNGTGRVNVWNSMYPISNIGLDMRKEHTRDPSHVSHASPGCCSSRFKLVRKSTNRTSFKALSHALVLCLCFRSSLACAAMVRIQTANSLLVNDRLGGGTDKRLWCTQFELGGRNHGELLEDLQEGSRDRKNRPWFC